MYKARYHIDQKVCGKGKHSNMGNLRLTVRGDLHQKLYGKRRRLLYENRRVPVRAR